MKVSKHQLQLLFFLSSGCACIKVEIFDFDFLHCYKHSIIFASSTDWHVGSSPDLQVFSRTPNRFVPATG